MLPQVAGYFIVNNMAGGWGILPAPQSQEAASGQTMSGGLSDLSKIDKLGEPNYDDKRYDKKEDRNDMLYGQSMYYKQGLMQLQMQEKAVKGDISSFFNKNPRGNPTAQQQQQWNKSLMGIEFQRTQLESMAGTFRSNKKRVDTYEDEFIKGGESSTGSRVALHPVNGTYLPILGQKGDGYGWMTPLEIIQGMDQIPGTDGRLPEHAGLSTQQNYSGSFNKFVDEQYKNVSKGKQFAGQTVGKTYGSEVAKYLSIITTSTDKDAVQYAAKTMMENLTESARLDLSSSFYEHLLHAHPTKDGIAVGIEGIVKTYTGEEAGLVHKLLSGEKMNSREIEGVNNMINDFGAALVQLQVPTRTDISQTVHGVKVSGPADKTAYGPFSLIAQDKIKPSQMSQVMVKMNGLVMPDQSIRVKEMKNGHIVGMNSPLKVYTPVPPQELKEFNDDATNRLIKDGIGYNPAQFTSGYNFFYYEDGTPNTMALLDGTTSMYGLTGRIQENFLPEQKRDKDGSILYDPFDTTGKSMEELNHTKVLTVEAFIAVPTDNSKTVLKGMYSFQDGKIDKGIDMDKITKQNFAGMDDKGKRVAEKYHIIRVWLPINKQDLPIFESKSPWGKGAMKTMEQNQDDNLQQIEYATNNAAL